ncbi:MAG: hypothetical protein GY772_09065 [bacterium]|jgi:death-on-curing protein|nr:hypothetical protein [bacterium]MDP7073088.1 hypothetical protein [Myxococcota bacterium]MDP7299202.1 hypothetical protein [Myxococcota bacterium]HJO23797.1 hypothetical protein [Myxococcota bacterium]
MSESTFDGELVHGTVFALAAAYLFHIARNHPFVDDSKWDGLPLKGLP